MVVVFFDLLLYFQVNDDTEEDVKIETESLLVSEKHHLLSVISK